ncbi:phosphoribosylanthranilate isomerase [Ignisphaera sp. 4213-co]|uniref:N-(5'-phosphoribosyl)anthranilate isomerase n=1 Tax=Ignisphaera cupida TaxID=3050454 RepID=A0ABD4Z5Q6_9CREN|nr:phosphoribosylanthranilate isomerase [Ignisphaera sp. 4213-co]MDK6028084.1 phosphoribosylanthranilate isomerase [Ignisphaera sp. 4213-co]
MRIKLKICGVVNIEDAIEIDRIGVDFIGMVTDPASPRYVPETVVDEVRKIVHTPIVSVKVHGTPSDFAKSKASYVQIHRVLSDEELEELASFDTRRFILYVPASLDYLHYLKKVQRYFKMVLFDAPIKGVRSDPKVLRLLLDHHREAGVAGGITLENVHLYLELEPMWIDVSSGVEIRPGKKDLDKVRRLKEVVHQWRSSH